MELHSLHPEVGYQQMFQSEIHKNNDVDLDEILCEL